MHVVMKIWKLKREILEKVWERELVYEREWRFDLLLLFFMFLLNYVSPWLPCHKQYIYRCVSQSLRFDQMFI